MKITGPDYKNICLTCGTRYSKAKFDFNNCPVCLDDRQYMKAYGQKWISYNELKAGHTLKISKVREDIYELSVFPSFGIGQRAFLIINPEGNVLWDCLPLLDEATEAFINAKGGLKAIAISHPHYYGLMHEWAETFDCPVYLSQADREWVMDEESRINFRKDEKLAISTGFEVIRTGGHFPGSTILHYKTSAGKNCLFIGDTLNLSKDGKHLSIMYSYPNLIPIPPAELFSIFKRVGELDFDAIFGAFDGQSVYTDAKKILSESEKRYRNIYKDL